MNKYFISYNVSSDSQNGFGSTELETNFKIKSIKDILEIAKHIEKDCNFPPKSLVILNWRRFEQ